VLKAVEPDASSVAREKRRKRLDAVDRRLASLPADFRTPKGSRGAPPAGGGWRSTVDRYFFR
jgi:hypothetical protein